MNKFDMQVIFKDINEDQATILIGLFEYMKYRTKDPKTEAVVLGFTEDSAQFSDIKYIVNNKDVEADEQDYSAADDSLLMFQF